MLEKSILEHKLIYLEGVTVGDKVYFGSNVEHFYFTCEMNSLHEFLLAKGANVGVFGGEMPDSESWIPC